MVQSGRPVLKTVELKGNGREEDQSQIAKGSRHGEQAGSTNSEQRARGKRCSTGLQAGRGEDLCGTSLHDWLEKRPYLTFAWGQNTKRSVELGNHLTGNSRFQKK